MFSRPALRTALNVPKTPFFQIPPQTTITTTRLPTTSLLQRSSLHNETTSSSPTAHSPPTPLDATPRAQSDPPAEQAVEANVARFQTDAPPTFASPLKVSKALLETLPFLHAQKNHYITALLHARPYLVTAGDELKLPFRMPNVQPGDVLRFNRATALGSREFTLKGSPLVDERLFECRVRVLGCDGGPMMIKEKTKRRQRHVKQARSKHRHTLLRIMDVRVKSVDELLSEGAQVVGDDAAGQHQFGVRE